MKSVQFNTYHHKPTHSKRPFHIRMFYIQSNGLLDSWKNRVTHE